MVSAPDDLVTYGLFEFFGEFLRPSIGIAEKATGNSLSS
jgi:hypothetical protein